LALNARDKSRTVDNRVKCRLIVEAPADNCVIGSTEHVLDTTLSFPFRIYCCIAVNRYKEVSRPDELLEGDEERCGFEGAFLKEITIGLLSDVSILVIPA
jgi:hypothetical protein